GILRRPRLRERRRPVSSRQLHAWCRRAQRPLSRSPLRVDQGTSLPLRPLIRQELGHRMRALPKTKDTPLVRTDFSDDAAWTALCASVERPVGEFRAYVTPVDDRAFDRSTVKQVTEAASGCGHLFTLVADERALRDPEHPILVIDLSEEPGRTFRV